MCMFLSFCPYKWYTRTSNIKDGIYQAERMENNFYKARLKDISFSPSQYLLYIQGTNVLRIQLKVFKSTINTTGRYIHLTNYLKSTASLGKDFSLASINISSDLLAFLKINPARPMYISDIQKGQTAHSG